MMTKFWIKIGAWPRRFGTGWEFYGVPHASKGKPACGKNEVALTIDLEIPDSYSEDPQLAFKVEIPERPRTAKRVVLDKDVISEAITQQIGMKVHLTVDQEEPAQ